MFQLQQSRQIYLPGRVSRVLAIRTNVSCEIESLIVSLIQGPAVKHLAWPA